MMFGEVDPAWLAPPTYNTWSIRSYKINPMFPRLSMDLGHGGVQLVPRLKLGSGLKLRISGVRQVKAVGEGIWRCIKGFGNVFNPKIEPRECDKPPANRPADHLHPLPMHAVGVVGQDQKRPQLQPLEGGQLSL